MAAPALPPPSRENTVVEAVTTWQEAMKQASDLRIDAELVEAKALLATDAKTDALRKAAATVASAEYFRKAEHAQARARAAGAVVDMLLGGRAPIDRGHS